jgi:hypothetical protein
VFGKFDREPMKRASVQSGYKPFNHLAGNQSQVIELVKLFYVENVFQNADKMKLSFRMKHPDINWEEIYF